jgi:multiphosphoryl transfer protein
VIGLVIVCHSAKLAEGVAELAAQMGGEGLRIGVAGGLDLPGNPLGTDAVRVARSIDEVWSEDGVLVLMDLGSALLSAEMALDLQPEERRQRILLTEAPLVEGAVAAAVAAGLGDSLEKVAEEARGALTAKAGHLAPPVAQAPPDVAAGAAQASPGVAPSGSTEAEFEGTVRLVVLNEQGLHMRPAALLVRTAAGFDADVRISNATRSLGPVSAHSLNAVATLGVRWGDSVVLHASGPQAQEALAAIRQLADGGFGEPAGVRSATTPSAADSRPRPTAGRAFPAVPRPAAGSVLRGLPASPGIAIGAARRFGVAPPQVPDGLSRDRDADWAALQRALSATGDDIHRAESTVAARTGERDAAIFAAHLLFLEDEALLVPARAAIIEGGNNAARAWADAVSAAAAAWEALDDPYQRARAIDLRSVGDQVLRHLVGSPADADAETAEPSPDAAYIVVATALTPTDIVSLDLSLVRGVACAFDSPTSHAAILANSLGVPTVVGAGRTLLGVHEGTTLVLDGETGTVTVDPPSAVVRAAENRRAWRANEETVARARAAQPAITRDGLTIHVAANVAGPADVPEAVAAGADGVGILRTEFLFLRADHLPSEDEQERVYRSVAEGLGGRPLTIRTLDVGADKQLPYLPLEREQNPFLGLRGIRLCIRYPELIDGQLRAALRVAADHPVRIMFPMVTTVDEVRQARELLERTRETLAADGVAVPECLEVGIMVEVPATALLAEAFVPHVDFFSLGTNDLAQYVLAAERGNADVAALADALHPAVLRLIDLTARAAAAGSRAVAVCGELAGDPAAVPVLLGLGVTELSLAPARIPAVKQLVRATDISAAQRLAADALAAESAAEVRRLVRSAAGGLVVHEGTTYQSSA